jgi:hypothetical protein
VVPLHYSEGVDDILNPDKLARQIILLIFAGKPQLLWIMEKTECNPGEFPLTVDFMSELLMSQWCDARSVLEIGSPGRLSDRALEHLLEEFSCRSNLSIFPPELS